MSIIDNMSGFGMIYTLNNSTDTYKVSIRSCSKDEDCQKIAMMYGGGGHQGAAGFYLHKDQMRNWF